MIQTVLSTAGFDKPYRSCGGRRPGEVMDTVAGIEKARAELGWEPHIPFEEGIRGVVADVRQRGSAA